MNAKFDGERILKSSQHLVKFWTRYSSSVFDEVASCLVFIALCTDITTASSSTYVLPSVL